MPRAPQFILDQELRDLLPPQSPEEREALDESIAAEGVREPLLLGRIKGLKSRAVLVDGYNRHEIAKARKKSFRVEVREFESREQIVEWMLRNQLGRRNLDPKSAKLLRGRLYNGRKRQGKGNAAEQVAAETGVSTRTVKRDGKAAGLLDALHPDARREILDRKLQPGEAMLKWLGSISPAEQRKAVSAMKRKDAPKPKPESKREPKAVELKDRLRVSLEKAAREVVAIREAMAAEAEAAGKPKPRAKGDGVVAGLDQAAKALSRWEVS